ncbi:MAG: methyltransferase domain-containing protein [Micromonosporaceae bacterium]|nr:methyltransferase domain-containing protein [Micromonosporaceae bacterium]
MRDTKDPNQYTFDNNKPTAQPTLNALGQMFDEFTVKRLQAAGVTAGARCLEVGAGAGSVASWMADQVGAAGEVVATDIKPQHIAGHPRLTVLEHDIVNEPMPAGQFDVIHARAVLAHLPTRREVLTKLIGSLAPGGAVVIEEMETRWGSMVLATPDPRVPGIFQRYENAMSQLLRGNGLDMTWARGVHGAMREDGLTGVETEGWQRSFAGGTGSALLAHGASQELRDRLVGVGMPAEDLDVMAAVTLDPRLVLRGVLLLSTIGRKAAR